MDNEKTTEIIDNKKKDPIIETVSRILKCVEVCSGIDDVILDILAKKDKNSRKTNMQKMVDNFGITGREVDSSILNKVNESD